MSIRRMIRENLRRNEWLLLIKQISPRKMTGLTKRERDIRGVYHRRDRQKESFLPRSAGRQGSINTNGHLRPASLAPARRIHLPATRWRAHFYIRERGLSKASSNAETRATTARSVEIYATAESSSLSLSLSLCRNGKRNAPMISLRAVLANRALELTNALMKPRQNDAPASVISRSFCCHTRKEKESREILSTFRCALFAAYGGCLSKETRGARTICY